jgi:hypothetical protein
MDLFRNAYEAVTEHGFRGSTLPGTEGFPGLEMSIGKEEFSMVKAYDFNV